MIADAEVNCVFLAAMLKDRHPTIFANLRHVLMSHGIEVRLLKAVRDYWAKDYCPVQIGPGKLVKFRYDPDYLRESPELRTGDDVVKAFRDLGSCRRTSIILDAGNIVAFRSKAILTDKIYKENPSCNRADLRDKIRKLLKVDLLIIIPKEPYDPIGHADSIVRFINEDTVLVNDYAKVDPGFGERLIRVLRRNHLAIETIPYFHEKRSRAGIPSAVGCFANFLRTESVLIAPIYDSKQDDLALRKLESVFPSLPIVPLNCTRLAREGGVLNCVSAVFRQSEKSSSPRPPSGRVFRENVKSPFVPPETGFAG